MKPRKYQRERPTRRAVAVAFNAQAPLDMPAKPLERKKVVRCDWNESPALERVEDGDESVD